MSRRRTLEMTGIRRAAEFSADRMVDAYESLLAELKGPYAGHVASA
jgi:hypothetical protein